MRLAGSAHAVGLAAFFVLMGARRRLGSSCTWACSRSGAGESVVVSALPMIPSCLLTRMGTGDRCACSVRGGTGEEWNQCDWKPHQDGQQGEGRLVPVPRPSTSVQRQSAACNQSPSQHQAAQQTEATSSDAPTRETARARLRNGRGTTMSGIEVYALDSPAREGHNAHGCTAGTHECSTRTCGRTLSCVHRAMGGGGGGGGGGGTTVPAGCVHSVVLALLGVRSCMVTAGTSAKLSYAKHSSTRRPDKSNKIHLHYRRALCVRRAVDVRRLLAARHATAKTRIIMRCLE
eukprot:COSAG02_NODE_5059_length_4681_cov_8.673069_3_plen_289_part_01